MMGGGIRGFTESRLSMKISPLSTFQKTSTFNLKVSWSRGIAGGGFGGWMGLIEYEGSDWDVVCEV